MGMEMLAFAWYVHLKLDVLDRVASVDSSLLNDRISGKDTFIRGESSRLPISWVGLPGTVIESVNAWRNEEGSLPSDTCLPNEIAKEPAGSEW